MVQEVMNIRYQRKAKPCQIVLVLSLCVGGLTKIVSGSGGGDSVSI